MYYVYLLRCRDGSLYAGITTDLARRFAEHAGAGRGAKYTTAHPPLCYEAAWIAPDRGAASRLEYHLKTLTKPQKEALLRGQVPPALALAAYTPAALPLKGAIQMKDAAPEIRARLFALQDLPYRDFQCRLMPTVDPQTVIGVRTPALRALAKELANTPEAAEFCADLPHRYYDENNLHALLIERIPGFDEALRATEAFLPHLDNWATCDLFTPRAFCADLPALWSRIRSWIASGKTYTVRFGIEMLMCFYLDAAFAPEYPALVAQVRSEEYYVNMMVAWYFATALARQREAILPYFEQRRMAPWTHNKAIQKAIESRRISDADKRYLRTLKIK